MQQKQTSAAKLIRRFRKFRYYLVLEGIAVGIFAGLVTVAFRILLEQADQLRQTAGAYLSEYSWWGFIFWLIFLLGLSILVTMLLRWEPMIGGSGIPQVEGELQGRLSQTWWRVLLAKFTGGVLSIGAGLSLGREGPSIQLGAMAGKGISQITRRGKTEEKMLITCGASAGLAAAFNAPLAGVLFSLEELHKNFSVDVLLSVMASSITADFLSRNVFGLKPVFDFSSAQMMPLQNYWMVLLLGILLGLLGVVYNFLIQKFQDFYAKIHPDFIRTAIPFLLAGILLMGYPAVLGGGHNLVSLVSQNMALTSLAILFLIKFLYSMLSFGAGVPGGIFLPMLVLGAISGSAFGQSLALGGLDVPLQNFVILGMAGLFTAIVRAPVTGIILISEMTGSFSHLLSLSLVCLTAYAVADLLHAKPVYDILLFRLLKKEKSVSSSGEKLLIECPVCHGCPVCGKSVQEIRWPGGALLVSVKRNGQEIVPHGDTILQAGDIITLLCDESVSYAVHRSLEKLCKKSMWL